MDRQGSGEIMAVQIGMPNKQCNTKGCFRRTSRIIERCDVCNNAIREGPGFRTPKQMALDKRQQKVMTPRPNFFEHEAKDVCPACDGISSSCGRCSGTGYVNDDV